MKTKFGVILILLSFIVLGSNAFAAVDYTFKGTITRTENRSIVPDNSPQCDGSTPTMPTVNYSVTLIDSTVTDFSFRIVKKSDNSAYYNSLGHTIITSGGSKNFDLATGELTYTITGIPKTSEILIVRLYTNSGGTGSPYSEQEISVSSDTRPKAGFVTFGNVGDGSDGGSQGSISSVGGFVTSASISNGASYSQITVNFTALDDASYVAMVTLQSSTGTRFSSNNVTTPVVYDKQTGSFKVLIEDNGVDIEDLRMDLVLQAY